jgi:dual specificity phosphatase 12
MSSFVIIDDLIEEDKKDKDSDNKKSLTPQISPHLLKKIEKIDIIMNNLYIGSQSSIKDYNNFGLIINIDYPYNNCPKDTIQLNYINDHSTLIIRLGLDDTVDTNIFKYFDLLCNYISTYIKGGKKNYFRKKSKVLVHCHAGISRSTTIILAYFIGMGKTLQTALKFLKSKRDIVNPNEGFMKQLKVYEQITR